MTRRNIYTGKSFATTETFEGESIEEKVRRVEESGAPIEAISPMIYTERSEGVKAEYNPRTDKWEVAQSAMQSINEGRQQKRAETLKNKEPTKSAETPEN